MVDKSDKPKIPKTIRGPILSLEDLANIKIDETDTDSDIADDIDDDDSTDG